MNFLMAVQGAWTEHVMMPLMTTKWFSNVMMPLMNEEAGTQGTKTRTYAKNVESTALNVVLMIVGVGLLIVGIKDIGSALMGDSKDWKKAGIGVVVLLIGGGMLIMNVSSVFNWGQNLGSDFSDLNK
mgnify:CR=1 FL=1